MYSPFKNFLLLSCILFFYQIQAQESNTKEPMNITVTIESSKEPFFINLPFVSIPGSTITNHPLLATTIVASIAAGGYVFRDYWLTPLRKFFDKKNWAFLQPKEHNKKDDNGANSDFIKSKARIYKPGEIKIKLKDVAGLQAAKLDVFDIMQFLKNPQAYIDMGAKIPKGVLLQGPPGNGKTLLAKAIAGEVECPFISVCASEFMEMFVGAGAARVRDLFAKAKELAPCIIFFDEFDTIGKKRIAGPSSGSDEQAQTLGQLLTLMDGFDVQKHPIIIMAATNRADILDPAVIRPGRFDRIVEVEKPLFYDRIEILKVHFSSVKKSDDIDIPLIARATAGFSGAELANLVNEAAILAVNQQAPCVNMMHIDQAYDNITIGREIQGMQEDDADLWQTAIHEAGHSIVRVFLDQAHPLYKVTITPRGRALGISYSRPLKEKYSANEFEMKAHMIVCLAGGLAEEEFGFGQNSGKSSDLQAARQIAYDMVVHYGMSNQLRYISYADIDHMLPNDIATKVHQEVQKIIDECYDVAKLMVAKHHDQIEALALLLMKEGTIFGNVVYRLCGVEEPKIEFGLAK